MSIRVGELGKSVCLDHEDTLTHYYGEEMNTAPVQGRIVSVDVLRGFDMFWITGGTSFVLSITFYRGSD